MNIGERIKKYRKLRKLTQKELGEKLGVSSVAVTRYENNTRQLNMDMINKIAEALDISKYDILDDIEDLNSYSKEVDLICNLFSFYGYEIVFFNIADLIEKDMAIFTKEDVLNFSETPCCYIKSNSKNLKTLTYDEFYSLKDNIKKFIDFEFYKIKDK